jgi:hypothetical protein
VSRTIEEVWFSGAHADVGGTYSAGAMLDGELSSVSLNWMLNRLRSPSCPGCGRSLALPWAARVPEDRLSAVHDGKRTSPAYGKLYRQSRKPRVYWYHVYGRGSRTAVHASVFDRLEWLFALDPVTPGCDGSTPPGKPVICAREIASHGLVPELLAEKCLETTRWGYRLTEGQTCVAVIGARSRQRPAEPTNCFDTGGTRTFKGMNYKGDIAQTNPRVVERHEVDIPYPRCLTGPAQAAR